MTYGTIIQNTFTNKELTNKYALGLRGGTDKNTYSLSVGYDKNNNNLIGNGYNRLSINSLNTFRPVKNLELTAGVNYSKNNTIYNNDFAYGSYVLTGNPYLRLFPYAKLVDDQGNPVAISRGLRTSYLTSTANKGFLDWNYVPINEIKLADNTTKVEDLLLRFGLKYQITPALSANLSVQNEKQIILGRNYRKEESYYVRNLINRFSVYDAATETFAYNFPKGAILELQNIDWMQNNARMQFNYDKNFEKHAISLLAGFELKELKAEGYTRTSYGYNDQFGTSINNLNYGNFYPTNPIGSDLITAPDGSIFGTLDRNVSYFAVGTYAYDDKYTVNLSARKDGANLFGAKANDKIQPFWSVGLGWNLSNERFFKLNWLSYLKLRTSFGYQGNTSTNSSSYLTGIYLPNDDGAPFIFINTAPNPRLQWESIQNINLGLDFSIKDARVSGSIEAYHKKALNLIQATALPLQSGFSTYQANTGSVLTQGIEAVLNVKILPSGVIKWNSSLVFSGIKDRVLKYDAPRTSQSITSRTGAYATNRPLDAMFSYKWAGLNPGNGNPRGYLNGKISEDYVGIIANFDPDSLVYNGSRIPIVYGSFRNDFSFKNLNLSVNIAYRLGYVFRRPATSLNYTNILQSGQNEDYNLRWKKPGDEKTTDVPSIIYPNNAVRNNFYQSSEVLIQRGDHVRLQDVKLSYSFPGLILRKLGFHDLKVFTYANNLPILWRMNKLKIDPSAIGGTGQSAYPNPFTISFGLTANL